MNRLMASDAAFASSWEFAYTLNFTSNPCISLSVYRWERGGRRRSAALLADYPTDEVEPLPDHVLILANPSEDAVCLLAETLKERALLRLDVRDVVHPFHEEIIHFLRLCDVEIAKVEALFFEVCFARRFDHSDSFKEFLLSNEHLV